jgi:hypothetical protein
VTALDASGAESSHGVAATGTTATSVRAHPSSVATGPGRAARRVLGRWRSVSAPLARQHGNRQHRGGRPRAASPR